jgi:hypothetical protein
MGRELKSTDLRDGHFHSLGMLMSEFSRVETVQAQFIAFQAKLEPPIARALLSGLRLDAGASMVRRLYEATGRDIEQSLSKALAQLLLINGVRNDLVHYGAVLDGPKPYVTNVRAAHTAERIRITEVDDEALAMMTADLSSINLLLLAMMTNEGLATKLGASIIQNTWLYQSATWLPSKMLKGTPE